MSYAFLVIDSTPGFSVLVKGFLSSEWPDVTVDACNAKEDGWPDTSSLLQYHAIFLATAHATEQDGLDWFKQYCHAPNFPKCIIIGASIEPNAIESEAISAGAVGFYSTATTSRDGMVDFVRRAIEPSHTESIDLSVNTDSLFTDSSTETIGYDFKSDAKIASPFSRLSTDDHPDQPLDYDFPDLDLDPTPESNVMDTKRVDSAADQTSTLNDASSEPVEGSVEALAQKAGDNEEDSEEHIPEAPAVQKPKLRLNGYILEKKIAEGGMSSIYLCVREEDGQQAVLKTISPKLAGADKLKIVERTHLEYEVISRIQHPNVVRLYDHGTVKDIVYTTMEYFSTGDLKQRMHKGITQRQGLSYMLQITEGLNAIHGCGIIHRDLKPANIMFRDDDTLAILDFGIAKDITRKLNLTPKGMRLGTPSYMSPEQGNKGYNPGATSDLYSLGVILYEMLTKERPYRGSAKEVVHAHINDPIPTLPNQFYELQPLLERLMAKFPHERFESAYDLNVYIKENFRFDATLALDII